MPRAPAAGRARLASGIRAFGEPLRLSSCRGHALAGGSNNHQDRSGRPARLQGRAPGSPA
jgi:hypothetical protein